MPVQKHSVETVKTTLQIDESLSMHETGWIIQRIGWVVIIAVMVAGILGLFGGGPVSKTQVFAGNIKATYERFYRFEAEMKITVESSNEHISNISFPQDYIKNFKVLRFVPEPGNNISKDNEIVYQFLPAQNHIVSIYLVPTNPGRINGNIKVNGNSNLLLHHFIYL